jgi:FlaA1/EpsC-like NDP-sugar epimerase
MPTTPGTGPHRPAQTAEPKPTPGVVLIGTRETVAALASQVTVGADPTPVGALVVGGEPGEPTLPTAGGTPLPVLGGLTRLAGLHPRPRAAVVSLPGAMPMLITQVREALARLGIEERFVPTLADAMSPRREAGAAGWFRPQPAPVDPAALIGRDPHQLDSAAVGRILRGKRVLITGAGGSIGSELARIAAGFEPEMLVLMERSENALFEIDRRVGATGVQRRAVLHDVVDAPGTARILGQLRPDVVFHAAAHKHVPLMEDHPAHAVTNNIFGTKSVADGAAACGCGRFVLISTDKAVHPTSVMGATKRIAEQYVRHVHGRVRAHGGGHAPTTFSVVRFGNVLGSACSVLPIWAAQLADGGPITITDPRMTRFFMTIPEAATLVVQAAAMSTDVEDAEAPLFVLDMGDPIRVVDLAERLVRLQGLEPVLEGAGGRRATGPGQVEIVFTGIRPGEKLDEELTYAEELLRPTRHPGIRSFDAVGDPLPDVATLIGALDEARRDPEPDAVLGLLRGQMPGLRAPALRRAG